VGVQTRSSICFARPFVRTTAESGNCANQATEPYALDSMSVGDSDT